MIIQIPNLWIDDELNTIYDAMTPVVKKLGLPARYYIFFGLKSHLDCITHVVPTLFSIPVKYATFVGFCRDALHIVLCMSPVSALFRQRLLKFPSLLNCTTIDWYLELLLSCYANNF